MKQLATLLLILIAVGCNQQKEQAIETTSTIVQKIDVEAEKAALEKVRNGFMNALKEKRYQDIGQFMHPDMKAIGPGSEEWKKFQAEREAKLGQFSYDSIRMFPTETVILSDSMAYDFGVSKVYYTNSEGKLIELQDSFLVLMKKGQDGQWKLFREVASATVK